MFEVNHQQNRASQETNEALTPGIIPSLIQSNKSNLASLRSAPTQLCVEDFEKGSLDSLKTKLVNMGYEFVTEKAYFDELKNQFRQSKKDYLAKVDLDIEPNKIHRKVICLDGFNCFVYGCIHDVYSKKEYRDLNSDAVSAHKNLAFEDGLNSLFSYHKDAIGMSDHDAVSSLETIKVNFKNNVFVWNFFKTAYAILLPTNRKAIVDEMKIPNSTVIFEDDLPRHLQLEIQIRNNIPLDQWQKRSLYMAEFVRHWKTNEDRALHVGIAHMPEIEYFLKNPYLEPRICRLAKRYAEEAESNPYRCLMRYQIGMIKSLFTPAIGMFLGLAPWAYSARKVLELVWKALP